MSDGGPADRRTGGPADRCLGLVTSSRTKRLVEAPSHLTRSLAEGLEFGTSRRFEEADLAAELYSVGDLRQRTQRDVQEPPEFAAAVLGRTLRDVDGRRERGPPELTREAESFFRWERPSSTIDRQR
jgi:hypothetical protein